MVAAAASRETRSRITSVGVRRCQVAYSYGGYSYSSYASYGYGYYGSYGYYSDAIYGYMNTVMDPSTGYTHIHSVYSDASGSYYLSRDEDRGPNIDQVTQTARTYYAGVYTTDMLNSTTPLDGEYHTYGTRYTNTYDINSHIETTNNVYFASGYSFSDFHSYNYETGASIASNDTRFFYAYGYNEYTTSSYSGPNGYNASSVEAYHYTG
jgi:hypothetical protein